MSASHVPLINISVKKEKREGMGRGWGEGGERMERGGRGSSLHEQNGLTKIGYTVRVFVINGLYQFCANVFHTSS